MANSDAVVINAGYNNGQGNLSVNQGHGSELAMIFLVVVKMVSESSPVHLHGVNQGRFLCFPRCDIVKSRSCFF